MESADACTKLLNFPYALREHKDTFVLVSYKIKLETI